MTRPGVRLGALLAAAGLGDAEVVVRPAAGRAGLDGALGTTDVAPDTTGSTDFASDTADVASDPVETLVTDVVLSSHQARPGALFACVPGARADGHDFAADALRRGAVATLAERALDIGVPQVVVPSVRGALGPVAAAFWSHPSTTMKVVGVTGTNGKTTTCALLAAIFDAEGWPGGVIGTLTGERTTPEAPDLQRRLAELRDQGVRAVAMEVSSHALAQHRVGGTEFAAAVFTNLSQDHLDYHETMSSYFEAKAQLFTRERVDLAVVNRADPWGARLVERLMTTGPTTVTFAPEDAADVELSPRRASFTWRGRRFELNMGGRFNVANALAAATTARELGVGWDAVTEGLASLAPVKGRFQVVDEGQPFTVLVDFAHTPGALAELLGAARDLARDADPHVGASTVSGPDLFAGPGDGRGRVILVFGAGGDRDRAKRPLMGHVAGRLADVVVITSDNPRSEEPLSIIDQVASGVKGVEGVGKVTPWVEVDRAQAIAGAIGMARKGDVLVVAGKGHETGQDFGTHVLPFDDVEVARLALRSHRVSGHAGDDGGSHAGDSGSGAPG